MRAVRGENGSVCVVDVPPPSGDGVRVKIRAAGICGSDLHMIEHGATMGFTLGHELAGELSDGRSVAIEPLAPCETCACCRAGDYNLCGSAPQLIFGIMRDGGMSDELLVPPRCLVPLPSGIAVRDASLVEPLAVAVHGFRMIGLRGGQRVAVVGGGSIGLCAVAAARFAGAEVSLEARYDRQREAGERLGATPISGTYDVVVECAGSDSAVQRICELGRPGATLVLLSVYWAPLALPGLPLMMKELRIQPSSMYGRTATGRDIEAAAALLASNPEIPGAIITHRLPLDAAAQAFDIARDRKSGAIKVVLEP